MDLNCDEDHPEKLQIRLYHYRQRYNWDCGISCVLMVLPRRDRAHLLKHFVEISKKEDFFGSTWTVDLCYLLKKYRIRHVFYTVTLGVHPGYHGNSFYHSILNKDEKRVNRLFETATANGMKIERTSMTFNQIINHLPNGPVIVLTNAKLLNCDVCKLNKVSSELRKCLPWPIPYQGHFVVVCGYDANARKVYYRNPSLTDRVCVMSVEIFEQARKCYGTDEDCIFIFS